jgi:hypothetical protein
MNRPMPAVLPQSRLINADVAQWPGSYSSELRPLSDHGWLANLRQ